VNGRFDVERQVGDERVHLLVARMGRCLALLAFDFVPRLGGGKTLQTLAFNLLAELSLSDVRVVHCHVVLAPLSTHPLVLGLRLRDQFCMLLLCAEQSPGSWWLLVNRLRRVHKFGHRPCRRAVVAGFKGRMIHRRDLQ
jgi:hypothetical protein